MSHKALNSTFVCTDCLGFKSQVVEVGRHCKVTCATSLLRQGHLQLRTMARGLLVIPGMVTPLGSLCQFWFTLTMKKHFPMLRQSLPDVQSWGKGTATEARPHKTKHSYMGCLNIHLPEQLPVNPAQLTHCWRGRSWGRRGQVKVAMSHNRASLSWMFLVLDTSECLP